MTPAELRRLVTNAEIYKASLGKGGNLREEAISKNMLVFNVGKKFYEAKDSGAPAPTAGNDERAYKSAERIIKAFTALPENALVVNWNADGSRLKWGLTEGTTKKDREEIGEDGQPFIVFHQLFAGGWRETSIGGTPLIGLHPKTRDLAVNPATLSRVETNADYLRNLILDLDTSSWEARPEWLAKAKAIGWHPVNRAGKLSIRADPSAAPLVREIVDSFLQDIRRMAATTMHTVAYANGQTILVEVKAKDTDFKKEQLEEEIAAILTLQKNCCALTSYQFKLPENNPHLRPSLDRKDSSLGYVAGNLQVVTRAANFFKSASDEKDWKLKAKAMRQMAIAMQQRRIELKAK